MRLPAWMQQAVTDGAVSQQEAEALYLDAKERPLDPLPEALRGANQRLQLWQIPVQEMAQA